MNHYSNLRVAVLRGGPSSDYDKSLQSGNKVLSSIRENLHRYEPVDIFISKDGVWHSYGLPREPHEALAHVDIVWNSLQGEYGEDGRIQQILDGLKIPYTGSGAVSSALAWHKDKAKEIFKASGLLTPDHILLDESSLTKLRLVEIFRNFLHPVVIKPSKGKSLGGVRLARTFQELEETVQAALEETKQIIVEQFVRGRESSCAVVEEGRGEKFYAFLPTGDFNTEINKRIEETAKVAHQSLGLRCHSVSQLVVTPRGKIYILDSSPQPELDSDFLKALEATGWKPDEYIDHVLRLALV